MAVVMYGVRDQVYQDSKAGLVFFRKAIQAYAADSTKENRTPVYPQSLNDLIQDNYLNREDLRDFSFGMTISYSPPTLDSPDDFILLEGTTKDYALICPLKGAVINASKK